MAPSSLRRLLATPLSWNRATLAALRRPTSFLLSGGLGIARIRAGPVPRTGSIRVYAGNILQEPPQPWTLHLAPGFGRATRQALVSWLLPQQPFERVHGRCQSIAQF